MRRGARGHATSRPRRPLPAAGSGLPNVLIVCSDSLRPDHVTPEIMPRLCEFLGGGHRFEGVQGASWTLPSVGQMLFGRDDVLGRGPLGMVGQPSLAGRLAGTHASGAFLGFSVFGLYTALWLFRDFHHLDSCSGVGESKVWPAARTLDAFQEWRQGLPDGLPWFGYVHLCEVHVPYLPREWYGAWEDPPEESKSLSLGSVCVDPETGGLKASAVAGDYLRRRYQAYCTAADAALAPLWTWCRKAENLLVCVVSDHGEGMGEGNVWHHGDTPAFQRPEILTTLFGVVPPGDMAELGPVTQNSQLWDVIAACLPRGHETDEAEIREKLSAIGYLE